MARARSSAATASCVVAALDGDRDVLERRGELLQQWRGGAPHQVERPRGKHERIDEQGHAAADERVEEARERDAVGRRLQRGDERGRDRGLGGQHLPAAEEDRRRRGQQHHERELGGARADLQHEQVGDRDAQGDAERDLRRPPAALADGDPERDDRRDGGEERALVTEHLGGEHPGDRRRHGGLEDRPPRQPKALHARAPGHLRALRGLLDQRRGAIGERRGVGRPAAAEHGDGSSQIAAVLHQIEAEHRLGDRDPVGAPALALVERPCPHVLPAGVCRRIAAYPRAAASSTRQAVEPSGQAASPPRRAHEQHPEVCEAGDVRPRLLALARLREGDVAGPRPSSERAIGAQVAGRSRPSRIRGASSGAGGGSKPGPAHSRNEANPSRTVSASAVGVVGAGTMRSSSMGLDGTGCSISSQVEVESYGEWGPDPSGRGLR